MLALIQDFDPAIEVYINLGSPRNSFHLVTDVTGTLVLSFWQDRRIWGSTAPLFYFKIGKNLLFSN